MSETPFHQDPTHFLHKMVGLCHFTLILENRINLKNILSIYQGYIYYNLVGFYELKPPRKKKLRPPNKSFCSWMAGNTFTLFFWQLFIWWNYWITLSSHRGILYCASPTFSVCWNICGPFWHTPEQCTALGSVDCLRSFNDRLDGHWWVFGL